VQPTSTDGVQSCSPRPDSNAGTGAQFLTFSGTQPLSAHVGFELVIRPPDGSPTDWTVTSVRPTTHVCRLSKIDLINAIDNLLATSGGTTTLTARSKEVRAAHMTVLASW
jgi:hypothetical protein